MAYPSLASSRRTKRRRRLLIALLILIALLAVVLAVRHRTDRRNVADYLAVAKEVAEAEAQIAVGLEDLLSSLHAVDRPEALTRLSMLAESAQESQTTLAALAVPEPVSEAHGYLFVAASSWSDAVGMLDEAFVAVLDSEEDTTGMNMLEEAFDLLRVGDVAYGRFAESIAGLDPDLVTREYPPVLFVAVDNPDLFGAQHVALRLQGVFELGERHDIAVTAAPEPAPVGERNSIPLVPFSETFAIQAVVSNQGNLTEERIVVAMELVPSDNGDDGISSQRVISGLDPGEATTLLFDSIVLRPGGLYEVALTATIAEDVNSDNDVWNLVFQLNENT